MLTAAILYHLYDITGSVLQLGILGFVRFVAAVLASLIGGAAADKFDRRKLVIAIQVIPLLASVALFATTEADIIGVPLIYGTVFVLTIASASGGPARQAMVPSLVQPQRLSKAITISTTLGTLARIAGPVFTGFLLGWVSAAAPYGLAVALIIVSMISMLPLRPRPFDAPRRAIDVQAIREGLGFVWNRSILLGIMVLDLIAVIFAGATALLPVFATDIMEVGPRGYGLLTASVEFGAMLMAGMFLFLPQVEKAGRALFLSVAAFGIATLLFGLSDWFILSLLAYMAVGMADEASVVMRMTTIQLVTPPELQGRVNSVNFLFAVSANELGAVESGFVGAAIGARWAVVTGARASLTALAIIAIRTPELRRYTISSSIEQDRAAKS